MNAETVAILRRWRVVVADLDLSPAEVRIAEWVERLDASTVEALAGIVERAKMRHP